MQHKEHRQLTEETPSIKRKVTYTFDQETVDRLKHASHMSDIPQSRIVERAANDAISKILSEA